MNSMFSKTIVFCQKSNHEYQLWRIKDAEQSKLLDSTPRETMPLNPFEYLSGADV